MVSAARVAFWFIARVCDNWIYHLYWLLEDTNLFVIPIFFVYTYQYQIEFNVSFNIHSLDILKYIILCLIFFNIKMFASTDWDDPLGINRSGCVRNLFAWPLSPPHKSNDEKPINLPRKYSAICEGTRSNELIPRARPPDNAFRVRSSLLHLSARPPWSGSSAERYTHIQHNHWKKGRRSSAHILVLDSISCAAWHVQICLVRYSPIRYI